MSDKIKPAANSETMYKDIGSNPAVMYEVITPSDTVDLSPYARALRIGITGDVTVLNSRGESVLFTAVLAGETLPCMVKRVMDTGTDADNIVAYYG